MLLYGLGPANGWALAYLGGIYLLRRERFQFGQLVRLEREHGHQLGLLFGGERMWLEGHGLHYRSSVAGRETRALVLQTPNQGGRV